MLEDMTRLLVAESTTPDTQVSYPLFDFSSWVKNETPCSLFLGPHKLGSSVLLFSRLLLLNRCPLSVLLRYQRLYAFRQECVRIPNICVR